MGYFWGFVGVAVFSLTLPMTRLTAGHFDPLFVGIGRAAVAGLLGAIVLGVTRSPWPVGRDLFRLGLVALGLVGFGVFTSFAMQTLPSSHGAVVIGLLPLATAVAGSLMAKERHGPLFWIAGLFGSVCVVGFAFAKSGWRLQAEDLDLFAAVAMAAVGYAEGGRLSRQFGGWRVISWAVVLALPVTLPWSLLVLPSDAGISLSAWSGFFYTAFMSQFLGFFAWYYGLAKSGIGKVGQIQLLQTFLTVAFGVAFLSESADLLTLIVAVLVVLSVVLGRMDKARHPKETSSPS